MILAVVAGTRNASIGRSVGSTLLARKNGLQNVISTTQAGQGRLVELTTNFTKPVKKINFGLSTYVTMRQASWPFLVEVANPERTQGTCLIGRTKMLTCCMKMPTGRGTKAQL